MTCHRSNCRRTDHPVGLETLFLLEGLDQRHELRRIVGGSRIGGQRRGMLGQHRLGRDLLDRTDDPRQFRIALPRLQKRTGCNGDGFDRFLGVFRAQTGQFGAQGKELRALRIAVAKVRRHIRAHAQHVEHGRDVDALPLEVVVAGNLVGIDPTARGILHIGQHLGGQSDFEAHQLALALFRIGGGTRFRRHGHGIILGRQPGGPCIGQRRDHLATAVGKACVVDPDQRLRRVGIIGLYRLGDLVIRPHIDLCEETARTEDLVLGGGIAVDAAGSAMRIARSASGL